MQIIQPCFGAGKMAEIGGYLHSSDGSIFLPVVRGLISSPLVAIQAE
jgi:hypothetical protein